MNLQSYWESNIYLKTAYLPCANGSIGRFYRHLKTALTSDKNSRTWLENLSLALLSIWNVIKEDLWFTALEMVFGTSLTLPGQFCKEKNSLLPTTTFVKKLSKKWTITFSHPQENKYKTFSHQKIFTTANTFLFEMMYSENLYVLLTPDHSS